MSIPTASQIVFDVNVIAYETSIVNDTTSITNTESILADTVSQLAMYEGQLASYQAQYTSDQAPLSSYLQSTYSLSSTLSDQIAADANIPFIISLEAPTVAYLEVTFGLASDVSTSIATDSTVISYETTLNGDIQSITNTSTLIDETNSELADFTAQLTTYQTQQAADQAALIAYLISIGQPS